MLTNWPEAGSFLDKMGMLDAALTGASAADIWHSLNFKPKTAKEWLEQAFACKREWYLSDGGYSRVCLNEVTGKLFLTSNSTDRVKEAWSRCAELISDVEVECQMAIEALERKA
jgi:hypothetical protein